MRDPLGLSIGTTNFVAVRAGEPPVTRRSQLTLFAHRSPQIGAPAEHRGITEAGLLIDGFVERIGGQKPLVAPDGSAHSPYLLLVDAIDAMVEAAGATASQLAVAVPAHWSPAAWQTLHEALLDDTDRPTLGASPYLVSDAVAALTAFQAERGLASRGVVALLDFGGGGTNITLADAASGFQPINETLRYPDFSGNLIDQAILARILGSTSWGDDTDPGGTAAVGDLAALTDECRQAKERLSTQTAVELTVELPGYRTRITLTEAELDQLIGARLDGVMAALEEVLHRNRIDWHDLATVATAGGGAHIPLITQRLSERHQVAVVTSQQPAFAMAVGAAICAGRGAEDTGAAATAMAPAAGSDATIAGPAVSDSGVDEPGSAAVNDLAWSHEEISGNDEPQPFVDEPYDDDLDARRDLPIPSPRPDRRSYHLPQLALGIAALVAMIAVAGVAYTLTSAPRDKTPTQPTRSATVPVAPPTSELPSSAPTAAPPVPSPSSPTPPPPVMATTTPPPPVTTTTTPPPPSTTTPEPTTATTTTTTSTATPTTTTTTKPAPSTTTPPPPTTTTVPMTTEYLTIPLVPVPIPIQVPES